MPYGTVNVDSVVNSDGVTSGGLYGFKNRIINGAMVIDQRNAGASVTQTTTAADLPVDRWIVVGSVTSKFTAQRNAGSVTPPAGFTNYVGCTSSAATSVGASDFYLFQQHIEGFNVADLGWGTANAATVTLSFWVRSSLTGTFGGAFTNSANNRSYPFSFTITSANTWEQKSITVSGDTTGTWLTDNGRGISVRFSLGAGSTYSGTAGAWSGNLYYSATGATSVVGTNGATFYITGVQLEKGSTATSFDYRPYGTELVLCYRYYYQYVSGSGKALGMGTYYASTSLYTVVQLPVTMRTTPTLSIATGTNYYIFYCNLVADTINSLQLDGFQHANAVALNNNTEISGTAGQSGFVVTNNASASLAFSSEL